MKSKTAQLLLITLLSMTCIVAQGNTDTTSTNWSLIEENEKVKVYTRNTKETSSSREIKSVIQVPQSPESLLKLLMDYPNATTWRQRTKGMDLVKVIDENNWFVNYVTDLPWPLPDRVALLKCNVSRDPANGKIVYAFEAIPEEGKPLEEVLEGDYTFIPLDNGLTEVSYRVTIDTPINAPAWIEGALIGDTFVTQMELLRNAVALPRYADIHIPE